MSSFFFCYVFLDIEMRFIGKEKAFKQTYIYYTGCFRKKDIIL